MPNAELAEGVGRTITNVLSNWISGQFVFTEAAFALLIRKGVITKGEVSDMLSRLEEAAKEGAANNEPDSRAVTELAARMRRNLEIRKRKTSTKKRKGGH